MWYSKHDENHSGARDYVGSAPDDTSSRYEFNKSARSGTNGCVEVAMVGDKAVCVRDSKNPESPVLTFAPHEWTAFIEAAKEGQFDILS